MCLVNPHLQTSMDVMEMADALHESCIQQFTRQFRSSIPVANCWEIPPRKITSFISTYHVSTSFVLAGAEYGTEELTQDIYL